MSLLGHVKIYFSGAVIIKIVGLISLPVITNLLTPDEYGTYSVFLSYGAITSVVLTLNLNSAVSRYWYEYRNDFNSFLGTSINISAIIFCVFSMLLILNRNHLSNILGISPNIFMLLVPYSLINIVFSFYKQLSIPQKRSFKITMVDLSRVLLGLLAGIGLMLIFKEDRITSYIYGYIGSGLFITVFLLKYIFKWYENKLISRHFKYILKYSLPLLPYTLSGIILTQFDRIMINSIIDPKSAGLYTLAYQIGMIFTAVSTAILMAWTPDYFTLMNNKEYDTIDIFVTKMLHFLAVLCLAISFYGEPIGMILTGDQFHGGLKIIPIIAFSYLVSFVYEVWGRNIGYAKRTIWISVIVLSSGILNILLNKFLLPIYGYEIAATTTLISYLFMSLLAFIVCKFILRIHVVPLRRIMFPLFIALIGIILMEQLSNYGQSGLLSKTLLLLVLSVLLLHKYRNELSKIINKSVLSG
ncbi:MAG: oligosaccharide flippase family protein [Bacteroidetes bacterium]|jgi:O-antigen/teichoic acid export membrane protein|nr:oligosaccharide flippase family protein [Bacteroidota bacterium]